MPASYSTSHIEFSTPIDKRPAFQTLESLLIKKKNDSTPTYSNSATSDSTLDPQKIIKIPTNSATLTTTQKNAPSDQTRYLTNPKIITSTGKFQIV